MKKDKQLNFDGLYGVRWVHGFKNSCHLIRKTTNETILPFPCENQVCPKEIFDFSRINNTTFFTYNPTYISLFPCTLSKRELVGLFQCSAIVLISKSK